MKKKKNKKKILILLSIILIIGAFFIINSNKDEPETVSLRTEVIEKRTIANTIAATGRITSSNVKNISSGLQGMNIDKVYVKVGDYVNEGDIICEFDVSTLEESLETMKSTLADLKKQKEEAENTNNTPTISNDDQLKDIEQQIKNAEDELKELKATLENKEKEFKEYEKTYLKEQSNFELVQNEYEDKQKDYRNKQTAYETQELIVQAKKLSYDRYFKMQENQLVQLDTFGNVIPKEEYQLDNYATNLHKTIFEEYNSSLTDLEKANQEVINTKIVMDDYKVIYDAAFEKFVPVQEKYNTLSLEKQSAQTEVTAQEGSIELLKTTYNTLKSTLENTQGSLDSLTGSFAGMTATLDSSISSLEAQIKTMEKQINNKVIKATTNGLITSLNVSEGDMYLGSGIATIKGSENFIIQSEIDEYDIPDIKVGMKVLIKTDATRNEELEGEVIYVAPAATEASNMLSMAGATSSGKATYKIEIALNENHERIRLGMNARLSIITIMKDNVLTVPFDAIHEDEAGAKYVEITKDDINTEKVFIKLGTEGSYFVEVVEGELTEGMKVVLPEQKGTALEDLINQMGSGGGLN